MTIKLTIQQAEALERLFTDIIIPERPIDMEAKLVYCLMIKIYKKLRAKLEARIKGSGYSLSVTDEEAMAYYVFFKDRSLGEHYQYEANFMLGHISEIDKQYA